MIATKNTTKISISLPTNLYEQLQAAGGHRGISSYVSAAVENKILEDKIVNTRDAVDEFIALRASLPKFSKSSVLKAVQIGR